MNSIPLWAKKYLTESGVQKIAEAVTRVEKKTSAEIVPIVVRRSSLSNHVGLSLFLFFWFLFLLFDIHYLQTEHLGFGIWMWIIYLIFSLICSILGAKVPFLQRLFLSRTEMDQSVWQRVRLEFYESNIKKTQASTGILFFVSLLERRAVVLADKAISDKLPASAWQEIVDIMIAGIKQGDFSKGMVEAIIKSESILEPLFPIKEGDINELSNSLIIKE